MQVWLVKDNPQKLQAALTKVEEANNTEITHIGFLKLMQQPHETEQRYIAQLQCCL